MVAWPQSGVELFKCTVFHGSHFEKCTDILDSDRANVIINVFISFLVYENYSLDVQIKSPSHSAAEISWYKGFSGGHFE